jgi:hypothetical protein
MRYNLCFFSAGIHPSANNSEVYMFRKFQALNAFLSFLLLFSIMLSGLAVDTRANDLVPSDDLVGGASVFVFRGSKKKPQEHGPARTYKNAGRFGA